VSSVTAARRLVVLPALRASGGEQMRLDERLLDQAREPVARRYVWDPPAVSLGKFQRLPGETAGGEWARGGWANGPTVRQPGDLDLVRRPTGGRAVLHGAAFEWSFALVFPVGSLGSPSLQASYRFVNDGFAASLDRCGVTFDPGREEPYHRSGLCFATALRQDLLVGGEKVVAVAQARRGSNVLVHGSVLERRPPQALTAAVEELLGEPWRGEGLARSGCPIDADVLWDDVVSRLATALEAELVPAVPHAEVSLA
jgi:lipoate-protein ligase A